jgi:hypothetical protein
LYASDVFPFAYRVMEDNGGDEYLEVVELRLVRQR